MCLWLLCFLAIPEETFFPPAADVYRLPSEAIAQDMRDFWERRIEHLKAGSLLELHRADWYEEQLRIARWHHDMWRANYIAAPHIFGENQFTVTTRRCLADLRCLVGAEAYAAGVMPWW